jgi:choline dehydrogenase-like flavoprotein
LLWILDLTYSAVVDYKDGNILSRPRVVHARKDIILAAGAINTPRLLLLSGIGPRAQLDSLGIPVVTDLAGVGNNMQDHFTFGVSYSATSAARAARLFMTRSELLVRFSAVSRVVVVFTALI